jgi:signal peptidase I
VPEGQVFVLGDNRQSSSDSRTFGSVPVGNIIGKVILRFWPFDRLVFFEW